jgi:diacylglycerol kinase
MKSPNLLASFRFALQGIVHAFQTQRNFKIHTAITVLVWAVGLWVGLSAEQWAILCVTIALVFVAELTNTSLEAVVDHVSPEFHDLAKIAKDCAAGAVFVAAMMAVVVGLLVIGPRLLAVTIARP